MPIDRKILDMIPEVTKWRHELHACPETAFEEKWTSGFVAEKLLSFGIDVHTGLAETGVVGTLTRGDAGSGTIGLRADMDALDIHEENRFSYRSRNDGKMHACGHDGHMAMLLGAAEVLTREASFEGTIHFIFQPAEENEGGGGKMVEEGLFKRFPVDSVFGMHSFPTMPAGWFATREGPFMAAFDVFEIHIKGTGGHAAMPQNTADPILASSHIISQLQGIVSRNLAPIDSGVLSVTSIHGGSTFNIIPEEVKLLGTARHFQPAVQKLIENGIKRVVKGVSTSSGVNAELKYDRRYPAVVNSPAETAAALKAAVMVGGADRVMKNVPPIMGSEDFAFMLQQRPGCYIGLGAGDPRPGGRPHQSKYDFNDDILPNGISYWHNLAKILLPSTNQK